MDGDERPRSRADSDAEPRRPWRIYALAAAVVVVLAGSLIAAGVARRARDQEATAANAAPATTPAEGAAASETATPVGARADGYQRTPDPCDLLPPAAARRHVPGAVAVPNLAPPRDPFAIRRCSWRSIELPDGDGPLRPRDLELGLQAFADRGDAVIRFDQIRNDMTTDELSSTERLLGDREIDDLGEAAHLRTVRDRNPTTGSTRSSVVVRERNLVVLVEYTGSKVDVAAHGTQPSRAAGRRRIERAAVAVAGEVLDRLPEPDQVAAATSPAPSTTGRVFPDPPRPCDSIGPELRDRMVPNAEEADYDTPELRGEVVPMEGTQERVCRWYTELDGMIDTTRELTLQFTTFTGEGQRAVERAIDGYAQWDVAGPFVGGSVDRFRRLPDLGDDAFVIAGHPSPAQPFGDPLMREIRRTPTVDTTAAHAGIRAGNLIMVVQYRATGPDAGFARELEAAAVEVATDVAQRVLR